MGLQSHSNMASNNLHYEYTSERLPNNQVRHLQQRNILMCLRELPASRLRASQKGGLVQVIPDREVESLGQDSAVLGFAPHGALFGCVAGGLDRWA